MIKADNQMSNQLTEYIDKGYSTETRTIWIDSDVDGNINKFCRALEVMVNLDPTQPVTIYVNTGGGEVYHGLSFVDMISWAQDQGVECHMIATGQIMSMGLVIFLTGNSREATEHASFMSHSVRGGDYGTADEVRVSLQEMDRLNDIIVQMLCKRTKKKSNYWLPVIKSDFFFNKEQSIKLGIVNIK